VHSDLAETPGRAAEFTRAPDLRTVLPKSLQEFSVNGACPERLTLARIPELADDDALGQRQKARKVIGVRVRQRNDGKPSAAAITQHGQ
jgi:hypothetical protein